MTSSAALTEDQNSAVHWFWPQMIAEKSTQLKKKPHTKNHCELGNCNVEFQTLHFNTDLNEFTSNSLNKTYLKFSRTLEVIHFLQTFQCHCDATGASWHAARGLCLRSFSSQHSLNVAHTVAVDGICRQSQTGGGVHLSYIYLEEKVKKSRTE